MTAAGESAGAVLAWARGRQRRHRRGHRDRRGRATPSGRTCPALVDDRFASRLFAQDATLWGPDAESESAIRLSWVGLAHSSRPLVDEVAAIRADLRRRASTTSSSPAWAARRWRPR